MAGDQAEQPRDGGVGDDEADDGSHDHGTPTHGGADRGPLADAFEQPGADERRDRQEEREPRGGDAIQIAEQAGADRRS
ncbi:hypothetical protein D3C87_2080040 [compost metagenome]